MKNIIFSALQFLLVLYIFLSGPIFIFSIPFILTVGLSMLIMFWAMLGKRLDKRNTSNRVPKGVYLITEGPYEIIRHPIAAGLLLFVSSFVQEYFTLLRFMAFLFFVILVVIKIRREETETERYFKHEYESYKKKTKRLIPYIY